MLTERWREPLPDRVQPRFGIMYADVSSYDLRVADGSGAGIVRIARPNASRSDTIQSLVINSTRSGLMRLNSSRWTCDNVSRICSPLAVSRTGTRLLSSPGEPSR